MISDVRDGDPLKALRREEVWSCLFLESLMAEYLFRFRLATFGGNGVLTYTTYKRLKQLSWRITIY